MNKEKKVRIINIDSQLEYNLKNLKNLFKQVNNTNKLILLKEFSENYSFVKNWCLDALDIIQNGKNS